MVLFLLLVLAAVILGIIGVTAQGLGYLLVIGVVLLVADAAIAYARWSRSTRCRPHPPAAGDGRPRVRHTVEPHHGNRLPDSGQARTGSCRSPAPPATGPLMIPPETDAVSGRPVDDHRPGSGGG